MKKKNLVKGCLMMMLICATGCGQADKTITEESSVVTTEAATEEMEEADEMSEETSEAVKEGSADLGEMSENIFSYQIMINGELYQMPMNFSDFTAKGWKFDGDESEDLDAGTYDGRRTFQNGEYDVEADVVNLTGSPQPYSDCTIVGVSISLFYNSGNDMKFILPKGIESGVSTLEDVKTAYGEPSQEFGEENTIVVYEEVYAEKRIELTFVDNVLEDVHVEKLEY